MCNSHDCAKLKSFGMRCRPQGSPHIAMQRSWYPFAAESCEGLYQMPSSSTQTNAFKLKWLAGTRVSRCYGCNDEIKNPPESVPDNLVVVYRDIREYRQKVTGQASAIYAGPTERSFSSTSSMHQGKIP